MPQPPIQLASPLPAADLLFESMTATGGLSQLGEIRLNLVSPKSDIKPEALLGKPVTVTVQREDSKRYFNGFVTRFATGAHKGRFFGYRAVVHPWLWFLTRTADCRIFQNKSVPDIVKDVFADSGVSNYEFKLFRSYRQWVYCVQYRETDFNFVTRLLEHEGIYWYFVHEDGKHKLILVDSHSAHDAAPDCKSLPFIAEGTTTAPDTECVSEWTASDEMESGKVALRSFDFERPSTLLDPSAKRTGPWRLDKGEMFDWQGDFIQSADGKQLAEDRIDELQLSYQVLQGASNAHGIEVGRLLSLTHHPRADQNAQYLITRLAISAHVDAYESGNAAGGFHCDFAAIPAAQQFRPLRRTPKPFVQGPQTAIVVGPSGEEIFTDKYGRVKVQFHWDRLGKKDENSSCWIRVSHPWAGKGWGAVSIPRIGQEVVVDFLEGDPDQPIITGRVYNAEQTAPFPLPGGAVVSGIKSKSHKAVGYNELSMDDTAGKEKVTIHGQYDMGTTVEHDQTTTVHNNRTDTIDVDDAESVGNNQSVSIGVDQKISVGNNQNMSIGVNRSKTVGNNETVTVGANRTETVGANESVTIGANQTVSVGSADSLSVGATQTVTVALAKAETIGAAYALSVGAVMNQAVGGALLQEVGGAKVVGVGGLSSEKVGVSKSIGAGTNITFQAGAKFANKAGASYAAEAGSTMSFKSGGDYSVTSSAKAGVDAASELVLKCGSAQIIMKSGGDIEIKGADISLTASGKITIKASGDLVQKGGKITQN